jgi:hypothetical protein
MIKFEFSIDNENLGHITLKENNEIISTSTSPFQSMMIYIAISDLIDGIIELIKQKRNQFDFVGADSSFGFDIKRNKNNNLTIITQESKKIITSESELVKSLWDAILDFLPAINSLEHDDVEFKDLSYMMQKFKSEFELSYR